MSRGRDPRRVPWTTDTIIVGRTIASNLYDAVDASARNDLPAPARQQLAWSLADVYEYRVDMSRDLQVGDNFGVVAEREVSPDGAVRIGRLVAATFTLSGSVIKAVRFSSDSSSGEFFDQSGKSMKAAFLRAPLGFAGSRVSSADEASHSGRVARAQGTDYAAATGTPMRAIGDGWSSAKDGERVRQHARSATPGFVTLRTPEPFRLRHPHGIAR